MKPFKQSEIARKAGVSKGFISRILSLNDPIRPSWKTAKKLANVTGTDPVLWLEGEPEEIRQALFKASAAVAEQ